MRGNHLRVSTDIILRFFTLRWFVTRVGTFITEGIGTAEALGCIADRLSFTHGDRRHRAEYAHGGVREQICWQGGGHMRSLFTPQAHVIWGQQVILRLAYQLACERENVWKYKKAAEQTN